MTARTSAHLAPLCDDLMSEMQKIKGADLESFSIKARLLPWIASKRYRRRKGSSAIFAVWTVIFFRATICRRT